jgi:hypothetical protein
MYWRLIPLLPISHSGSEKLQGLWQWTLVAVMRSWKRRFLSKSHARAYHCLRPTKVRHSTSVSQMTLILLPGLDGTGDLFHPLLSVMPSHLQTRIIRYPPDRLLSYDDLPGLIGDQLQNQGEMVTVQICAILLIPSFCFLCALCITHLHFLRRARRFYAATANWSTLASRAVNRNVIVCLPFAVNR